MKKFVALPLIKGSHCVSGGDGRTRHGQRQRESGSGVGAMGVKFSVGYGALCAVAATALLREVPLADGLAALWSSDASLFAPQVICAYCAFVVAVALLYVALPAKQQQGILLADGSRLTYRLNAVSIVVVSALVLGVASRAGIIDPTFAADHYFELWSVASLFSFVLSVFLFGKGVADHRERSTTKSVSAGVHKFIMGSELNPHIFGVDIKFFSYIPAMLGWLAFNVSFACKQYALEGALSRRVLTYQALSGFYILDFCVHQADLTTTWDIIAERFGFMLVWALYFFIPCMFSLQNVLLARPELDDLSWLRVLQIVAVFGGGLWIFRSSNSQKHRFKLDPRGLVWGRQPTVIGGKILASGWWGVARHMNYLGDLLVALGLCLPCGNTSAWGYFYFLYLLLLLVHREQRDNQRCRAKYGQLWEEYCRAVPYRMLPFVY